MPVLEPLPRFAFTVKEVQRYKDDVQQWDPRQDSGDLVAKALFIFERIKNLDTWIEEYFLADGNEFNREMHEKPRELLRDWLDYSRRVIALVAALQDEDSGIEELRRNIHQAEASLTPDDEFFDSDELADLRDNAIDAHRAGETEPLGR
jgi:hypothetical protein